MKNQSRTLLMVHCTSGCISSILCASAIIAMIAFRVFKTLTNRLILNNLISIFFLSLVLASQFLDLWANHWERGRKTICDIEGGIDEYFAWAMLVSTIMITVHLTGMVIFPSLHEKIAKLELFYILFPWLFPFLVSWIPLILNNYGFAGSWCWIRIYSENCSLNKNGLIEIYAVWFGELTVALILNNIALIVIGLTLCKRAYRNTTSLDYRKALKQTLPLLAYPITYQILSSFAIANWIYFLVHNGRFNMFMFYAHAVTSPSRGIFAPIVTFIYLLLLRKKIKGNVKKWCCCLKCKGKQRRNVRTAELSHTMTDPLIVSSESFTQYGITTSSPTTFQFRRDSELDEDCITHNGKMRKSSVLFINFTKH